MASAPLPYSPSVRAGDYIFISGQIGQKDGEVVEGGFEAQVAQSFANLTSVLVDNQIDVTKLVKTTVFVADMSDFATMNGLYAEFFGSHLPARSTVAVSALPKGAIFEIEAVAYVG